MEPLLDPSNKRDWLLPIQHPEIWEYYRKHQASFWVASEVSLKDDIPEWKKLSNDEKYYLKNVLAFFAASDFIVNENENKKKDEVTVVEYHFFLRDKMAREDVHSESYAEMLKTYIDDPTEQDMLKNAIVNIPSVKKKAEWFRKYIVNGTFQQRVVAGAIVEGIFFSSSFCAIYWFKKRGLLKGLCNFNELIAKDEGLHCLFECMIYNKYIKYKLPEEEILEMFREAVDIECEFCSASLPVSLIGMNADMMQEYVKYVADYILTELIGKKIYKIDNPFKWMDLISLKTKTDFFSSQVLNYAKQSNLTDPRENKIKIEEDY